MSQRDYSKADFSAVDALFNQTSNDPYSSFRTPKQEEEKNESWQITKGFKAGIDQTQAMGGGLVAAFGDALGMDSLKEWGLSTYENNMAEAAENQGNVQGFTDIEGFGDAVDWALYTAGNMAPMLGASLVSGGAGAMAAKTLAQGAAKKIIAAELAKGATREAAAKMAATHIAKSASVGAGLGAYASSAGMETGNIYGDLPDVENRASTAFAHGAVAGALDAIPSMAILKRLGVGKVASDQITDSVMKFAGKQMLKEGTTEGLQEVVNQHAQYWIDENKGMFRPEHWKQIIDASAAGALMGGVSGGTAGLLRPAQKVQQAREETAEQGGDSLDQALAGSDALARSLAEDDLQFNIDDVQYTDTPRPQADLRPEDMPGVEVQDIINRQKQRFDAARAKVEPEYFQREKRKGLLNRDQPLEFNIDDVQFEDQPQQPLAPNGSEIDFVPAERDLSLAPKEQPAYDNGIDFQPRQSRTDQLASGIERDIQTRETIQKLQPKTPLLPPPVNAGYLDNPNRQRNIVGQGLEGMPNKVGRMDSDPAQREADTRKAVDRVMFGERYIQNQVSDFKKGKVKEERKAKLPQGLTDERWLREESAGRPAYKEAVKSMVKELVKGGNTAYVRDANDNIINRTPSENPQWAQQILAAEGVSTGYVKATVDKAIKGQKPLGEKQARIISRMLDAVEQTYNTPNNIDYIQQVRKEKNTLRRAMREDRELKRYFDETQAQIPETDNFDIDLAEFDQQQNLSQDERIEVEALVDAMRAGIPESVTDELALRYDNPKQFASAIHKAILEQKAYERGQQSNLNRAGETNATQENNQSRSQAPIQEVSRGNAEVSNLEVERSGQGRQERAATEPAREVEPELLTTYTEADIKQREAEQKAAEAKEQADIAQTEAKGKADRAVSDFNLTGSDRKADANPNQGDVFDAVDQAESDQAQAKSDQVTDDTKINFSAIVRDKDGNPHHVNSKRAGKMNIAPFENGKPQIHSENPTVSNLSDYSFDNEWWEDGKIVKKDNEQSKAQPEKTENKPNAEASSEITWSKSPNRKKVWLSNDGQIITDESFSANGSKIKSFFVYASQEDRYNGNNYASGKSLAEAKAKAQPQKQPSQPAEKAEKPEAESKPTAKIEDFGEELKGAKKHKDWSFSKELTDADIAKQPLSKIWPLEEIDSIEDPFLQAFAFSARSEIPSKPRVAYKLNSWVDKVKLLRGLTDSIASLGGDYEAKAMELLGKQRSLDGFGAKVQLLKQLDRSQWSRIGEVNEYPGAYRFGDQEKGEPYTIPTPYASVRIDGRIHTLRESPRILDNVDAVKSLLDDQNKAASADADKFEVRGRKGAYFINRKGDSEYRKLKLFTDAKEAHAYRKEHTADLMAAWEAVKERDNVKKTDIRNAKNRPRTGKDYRNGKDVTPEQFSDAFGFRGVQFGNWVKQGSKSNDRQGALNQAYDALMDLSEIVGVPPKALSLNGELGLAFGARGKGNASAHYEPGTLVINLTKTKGAGTLAHEWFHALDHYFNRQRGKSGSVAREDNYITYKPEQGYVHKKYQGRSITRQMLKKRQQEHPESGYFKQENWMLDPKHPEGVRPEVERAFADLVNALEESPMKLRASMLDKNVETGYWSRIIERGARAFENYVIAKMQQGGYDNDYLANVVTIERFARDKGRYPYLLDGELKPVEEAFDALFSTIKTKETDQGIALFSRVPSGANDKPVRTVIPENFPDAIIQAPLSVEKKDPYYRAGKNGNERAATKFVARIITDEKIEAIRKLIDKDKPLIVAVFAEEAGGRNKLPLAYAANLSDRLGVDIETRILQINRPNRTSKDGFGRIATPALFDGSVEKGANYLIVDDTLTQGGTFANLMGHIESNGGKVAGLTVLTGKEYSAKLGLSKETLNKLREKHGNLESWFEAEIGYGYDKLTESEARYLHRVNDADTFRDRITEAGRRAIDSADESLLQEAAPESRSESPNSQQVNQDSSSSQSTADSSRNSNTNTSQARKASAIGQAEADDAVNRIIKTWKGGRKNIVLVDNFWDLPKSITKHAEQQNAGDGNIRGVYHEGKIYLVRDMFRSVEQLETTLFHEAYGHYGLEKLFGQNLMLSMNMLYLAIGGEKGINDIASRHNVDLTDYAEGMDGGRYPAHIRNQIMMEELFAHIAQDSRPSIKRRVKEIIGAIREWLRKKGYAKLATFDDNDVMNLLKRAREAAQQSEAVENSDAPKFMREKAEVPRFSRTAETDAEVLEKLGLGPKQAESLSKKISGLIDQNWKEAWKSFKDRSYEGMFDGLAGLKRAEEKSGNFTAAESGYVGARLATGVADTMHAILHYGAPKWHEGILQYKEGTRGLLEIFSDLNGDLTDWLAWMGAHRAEELMSQGRENNLTQDDIRALKARGRGKERLFEQVRKDYIALNKAMLDMSEEAGLIKPGSREQWESEYYVPFYRQSDLDGTDSVLLAPRTKRGLSHQAAGIKALKGGETATNDLLENILTNWIKLTDSAMKNSALLKTVNNLKNTDYLTDESLRYTKAVIPKGELNKRIRTDRKYREMVADFLGEGRSTDVNKLIDKVAKLDNEGYEQMWAVVAPTDPDIIRVQRDGKNEYYRVNDESLLRAVTHLNQTGSQDPITKTGRYFKRLLTTGVTASPDFILRNFIRDAAHAWAINPDGFKFAKDSMKGLKNALKEDNDYRALMFSGASFQGGYVHGTDPEGSAHIVRRALEAKGLNKLEADQYVNSLLNTPHKMKNAMESGWQKYRNLGDKIENANRLATFKAALKAGKPMAQAVFESKDLMDYSLRGNFAALQWFTDVIPFLNARLQGLSKLGRAAKENPRRVLMQAGIKLTAFSVALAMLNDDDERYQQLPDWDKDANWHFFIGDEHFRIPKPFEIGIMFGTIPERMYHTGMGNQENEKLLWSIKHNLFHTLNINPIPQFVMPVAEVVANRSFFFDAPIEGMADEGKLDEARYSEHTSSTMKEFGALGKWVGLSPKELEHLWNGYLGTMGSYGLMAADMLTNEMTGRSVRPEWKLEDYPVIKSFYKGSGPAKSTQYMTDVYDRMTEVDAIYRTIQAYNKEGRAEDARELRKSNMDKLRHRAILGRARKQLGDINKQMERISLSDAYSASMKRVKLDQLRARKNEIAQRISELTEDSF